jgi:hypothetical protein
MRLAVALVESPGVYGGVAAALVDEDGEVLPNQINTVLETAIGDVSTITVTFLIDGKGLCLLP